MTKSYARNIEDKYPITREGDPIALAEERAATFGLNWMSVRACSPTVEDESRILDLMTNVFMTLHLSSAEYLILPPDISHKSDLLRS
ncbi:phage terminase large subunit family protein [Klebsiella quasipneumoniae]|uniref:phage terminase large subunit family protein n=1 Tax=Klebsiella quasipneumoniae TaxID=1463165 RepID=UPI00278BE5A8|nr:phage terminase large subunit family protein [Klebsiella quasipneumoniae]UAW31860.1 phage terminase large subunit family protein [Klebsiella quasipneumoniae]